MASILLKVEVNDLTNGDLDGYAERFERWLRPLLKAGGADVPKGHVDYVEEEDREEDEPDED